jgi:hypothetical protein
MEGDSAAASTAPVVIGRYALYDRIASGGMAAVHLGRLAGPVGFTRTVAIKRLHAQFAADPEFVTMFLDEARLAARIQHPNVVPTIDVVATGGELFLVMEYVRGESASVLIRRANEHRERIPPRIVAAIVSGALQGLHAAHEAVDEGNKPLCIVHRDVSPQNILVGIDGTPRVLDFGVAKAEDKFHSTRGGEIKGKILYMSPEQLEGDAVDRTTDVYAMGLVLFELLTGRRMFTKSQDMTSLAKILRNELTLPSSVDPSLVKWDALVRAASARLPHERFQSARAMALEVERVMGVASPVEVADYVERIAGDGIKQRTLRIAEIESGMRVGRAEIQTALANELARTSADLQSVPSLVEGDGPRSERTGGSQVSLIAADPTEPAAPRSRRWMFAAAAAALVAVGGVAFVLGRADSGEAKVTAPATPPPSTATGAAPSQEKVIASPPPTYAEPAATTAPAPSASSSASVVAAATTAPATPRPTTQHAASKPGKPNCDRPYTVDSHGHMHFRTECL